MLMMGLRKNAAISILKFFYYKVYINDKEDRTSFRAPASHPDNRLAIVRFPTTDAGVHTTYARHTFAVCPDRAPQWT